VLTGGASSPELWPSVVCSHVNVQLVFGSTRNPFEMYVSLWAYGRSGRGFSADHLALPYGEDDPPSFQRCVCAHLLTLCP